MKNLIILLFSVLFCNSFSQNNGAILFEENFQLSEKSYPVNRRTTLIVLDSLSYYKRLSKESKRIKQNDERRVAVSISPEGENESFVLVNDSLMYTNYSVLRNYLLVRDSLSVYEWELLNETKEILGYKCSKAKTNFRGRTYYAFYTSEIPIPYGPWKFRGLPGLILEVTDSENKINISAISTYGKSPIGNFDSLENKLFKKTKILDWDDYKRSYVKAYKNFNKNMKSKFSNQDMDFEYEGNIPMGFEIFNF